MASVPARKMAVVLAILIASDFSQWHAAAFRDESADRLEFRILADPKHDRNAAEKAKAADGLEHPPAGYRWVWLGVTVTGSDPKFESKHLTTPGSHWKDHEFAGAVVRLTGENLAGSDLTKEFAIAGNTAETLELRQAPALFFKSVSSYRIDLTPSRADEFAGHDLVIRDVPDGDGRVKRSILVKLDRHNVTEKDLRRVVPDFDERLKPAVRFEFSREGADKFGALTREHLPEAHDAFKYQLGIILDGRLLSAPVINSEIRDGGIVELGNDARPEEVERIVTILRTARKK